MAKYYHIPGVGSFSDNQEGKAYHIPGGGVFTEATIAAQSHRISNRTKGVRKLIPYSVSMVEKPEATITVDWSNPITKGLQTLYLHRASDGVNHINYATGKRFTRTLGITHQVGSYGRELLIDGGAYSGWSQTIEATDEFTAITLAKYDTGTRKDSAIACVGSQLPLVWADLNAGQLRSAFYSSTPQYGTDGDLEGGYVCWGAAIKANDATSSAFVNGVKSVTGHPGTSFSTGTQTLYVYSNQSTDKYADGQFVYTAVWNRRLSDSEMEFLTGNKKAIYDLLKAQENLLPAFADVELETTILENRVPWTEKPNIQTFLNENHTATKGIEQVINFPYKNDLVNHLDVISFDGSYEIKPGPQGLGLYTPGSGVRSGATLNKPFNQNATNYVLTLAFYYAGVGGTADSNLYQYTDGSGSTGRAVLFIEDNAGGGDTLGTYINGTLQTASTIVTVGFHVASLIKRGTSIKMMLDGVIDYDSTLTADASDGDLLISQHKSGTNQNFNGWVYTHIAHSTVPSDTVIAELHSNVWDIFQPRIDMIPHIVNEGPRNLIEVKKPWTEKPDISATIDWSNPYSQGLDFLADLREGANGRNLVNGEASTNNGAPSRVITREGAGVYFDGALDEYRDNSKSELSINLPYTLIVQYVVPPYTGNGFFRVGSVVRDGVNPNRSIALIQRQSTNDTSGYIGTRIHISALDFGFDSSAVFNTTSGDIVTACLTSFSQTDHRLYIHKHGTITDTTDSGVPSFGGVTSMSHRTAADDPDSGNFTGTVLFHGMWQDRAFTREEFDGLAENLWQLAEPRSEYIQTDAALAAALAQILNFDRSFNVSYKQLLNNDRVNNVEFGQKLSGNDKTIPISNTQSSVSDRSIVYDNSQILNSDRIVNYDFRGILQADKVFPYDYANKLDSDRVIPYDYANKLDSDRILPYDFGNKLDSDRILPYDFGNKLDSDRITIVEYSQSTLADRIINIDSLKTSLSDRTVVYSNSQILQSDRVLPYSFTSAVTFFVDRIIPIEYGNKNQSDRITNVEYSQSTLADSVVQYDYRQSLNSDRTLPYSYSGLFNIDRTILVEFGGALIINSDRIFQYDFGNKLDLDRSYNISYLNKVYNDTVIGVSNFQGMFADRILPVSNASLLSNDISVNVSYSNLLSTDRLFNYSWNLGLVIPISREFNIEWASKQIAPATIPYEFELIQLDIINRPMDIALVFALPSRKKTFYIG